MSGTETASAALADGTPADVAAQEVAALAFKEKNGKLYARLLLATSDCPEGYSRAASQVVQSFASIGTEEFGDGRGAFIALEAKYRVDDAYRMQQLRDEFGPLEVTAADQFDFARIIQELRRMCIELDALGDKVMPTRKIHVFLKARPDKRYGSFKTVLLCEKPRNSGEALEFEDTGNRATSSHAMQIRGKASVHDGTGSHGCALNTVVHGGTREFCRQGGHGQGRSRRGNGGRPAYANTSSSNSNNSKRWFNSDGTSHGGNSAENAQGARGRGRGNQASGRGRGPGQDNGQNHKGRCRYCHNSPEHGWQNCPLRLSHEAEDAKEQANAMQESTSHAWFTQVHADSSELEDFKLVVGDNTQLEKAHAAVQPE